MDNHHFDNIFCSSHQQAASLAKALIRYKSGDEEFTILDIGCGTGETVFTLADHYTKATITGVDISPGNIKASVLGTRERGLTDRISFVLSDFMKLPCQPYDAVISGTTLHLIPATGTDILVKVAKTVRPGGYLIVTVPNQCLYNTFLFSVRRVFRLFRSSVTDRFILTVGCFFSRGKWDVEFIQQRIGYMYVLPFIIDNDELRRKFKLLHFKLLEAGTEPHVSFAQPKHSILIFKKDSLYG